MQGMITSKEIIEKTGISRATLNNYIKYGILPRPIVGPPRPGERGVKQIGYFPLEVMDRLDRVNRLKEKGMAMEEIAGLFQGESGSESGSPLSLSLSRREKQQDAFEEEQRHLYQDERGRDDRRGQYQSRTSDRGFKVSICDIDSPAYFVNQNFEIEWINKAAERAVFKKDIGSLADNRARNIFSLLFGQRTGLLVDEWKALVAMHVTVLQRRIAESGMTRLFDNIMPEEINLTRDIYNSRAINAPRHAYLLPMVITVENGEIEAFNVHAMTFREGTFFVYIPTEGMGSGLVGMLGDRGKVIGDLLRYKMPSLASFCVLSAAIQGRDRISADLLPGRYFELVNGLWEAAGPVFEKYNAALVHTDDGVVCYFLDQPGKNYITDCLNCSIELSNIAINYNISVKDLLGWDKDLFLNIGVNEGQEFFGAVHAGGRTEWTALGNTVDTARMLSRLGSNGRIWAAKSLINKLKPEETELIRFGVHRGNDPADRLVRNCFSRVSELFPHADRPAIADLPITEIKAGATIQPPDYTV